jgi:hypothetical protein
MAKARRKETTSSGQSPAEVSGVACRGAGTRSDGQAGGGRAPRCRALAGAAGDTLREDEAGQVWIRVDLFEDLLAKVRGRIDACLANLVNRSPLGLAHVTGPALDALQGLDPAVRDAARKPIEAGARVLFDHLERASDRLLRARADLGEVVDVEERAIARARQRRARRQKAA